MGGKENIVVLIAEDNEFSASFLEASLLGLNISSDIAYNGYEVLELIKNKKYDLIFMDSQMPIMNGYEATRELRAMDNEYNNIPIVGVTATLSEEEKLECFKAGMNEVLIKPYDIETLEIIIEKYVLRVKESFVESKSLEQIRVSSFQEAVEKLSKEMRFTYDEASGLLKAFNMIALEIITKIELAFVEDNKEDLVKYAHQIKGMSCNMRLPEIQKVAANIESQSENILLNINCLKGLLKELDAK